MEQLGQSLLNKDIQNKQGHSKQKWSEINKYPPLWNRFIKAIDSLGLPKFR